MLSPLCPSPSIRLQPIPTFHSFLCLSLLPSSTSRSLSLPLILLPHLCPSMDSLQVCSFHLLWRYLFFHFAPSCDSILHVSVLSRTSSFLIFSSSVPVHYRFPPRPSIAVRRCPSNLPVHLYFPSHLFLHFPLLPTSISAPPFISSIPCHWQTLASPSMSPGSAIEFWAATSGLLLYFYKLTASSATDCRFHCLLP